MANSIIAGNDFRLIIRAKKSTGAYLADMDLADVEDLRIYLTRAGRSKVLQSYTLDEEGHAVIYVSAGVVTNATYGIEMVGVYGGARLRAHNTSVFTISGHGGGNSGVLNDYYADIAFVINVAATDAYVQNAIEAHNNDAMAHPSILERLAGKVDDIMVDNESVVEVDPETGRRTVNLHKDQLGKVDDVLVNGESVLNEDNVAEITIPEKVSDLPNDADYATQSELTTGLAAKQDTITAVADPTIADDGGNPSASVDFEGGEMAFAFKNLKLRFSDLTAADKAELKGDKGDQGDSAVYDPSSPDAPDFVMANTTGQSTTKAMTQKAVTDEMYEQRIAIPFNVPKYYVGSDVWATHENANMQLYKLYAGDIVKIKANNNYEYVIAFVSSVASLSGSVSYANGTSERITAPNVGYEGGYYVSEDCYLYVLNNATTTFTIRTPEYVRIFSKKAENTKDDCNIYEFANGTPHVVEKLVLSTSTNEFLYANLDNHTERFCAFYELRKGDVVKIKGNGENTYAIAFIDNDVAWNEIPNKHQPTYVNGTTGPIFASSANEEKMFEVYEQCYLYVLGNTQLRPTITNRFPIIRVGKSIAQPIQSSTMESISAMRLNKSDATKVKGYYINASNDEWAENANGLYYLFPVKKCDLVIITPNDERESAIAFLDSTSHSAGTLADYSTWKSGVELVAEKTAFNVEEDCYLYVLNNASNISIVRYPSEIGIRRGVFASTETRLSLLEEEARSGSLYGFEGEKPVFGFRYDLLSLVELQSDMSTPTYTLHQGMAVYDNYLVAYGFDKNNSNNPSPTIGIYNITNGSLVAEIQLPYSPYIFPHGNSLSFGKNKLQSSSIMPPLYVTQWNGNKGVLVYDITLENGTYAAELVQAIIPDISNSNFTEKFGNGESDIVIDADNGKIYSVAYTLGTDGAYIDNDITNPTKVCVFDLPAIDNTIEHVISISDVKDYFSLKSLTYRQGCCVHSGKLLIERGNTAESRIGNKVDVHIVNLASREIMTKIPLNDFCEDNQSYHEPEGIAVYHGQIIMGWRSSKKIFKFVF